MRAMNAPLNPKFPFFLHGGDYNPDQWRHVPGVLDEDFRLFPLAGINSVSVGIFSWTALEPEEGRYEFGWLDDVMDRCAARGMAVVLATPSGARPFKAMRYHSLCIDPDTLPDCLQVTATAEDGCIMGVRHRELPVHGVQFHPESIMTPSGKRMLRNFLRMAE